MTFFTSMTPQTVCVMWCTPSVRRHEEKGRAGMMHLKQGQKAHRVEAGGVGGHRAF